MFKYIIVLFLLCHYGNGHTYHTGECPSVEPMAGFDMRQFLGIWYAIQKTTTASTCVVYNVTLGEEPGEYFIEQVSQHFALGLTPLRHEYSYTGQVLVPDPDVPGKMKISFPLNVAGDSNLIVFMTDYTTFAGLFTCQKLGFAHRQSATLLSRTKTLDKIYIDKLRSRLSSFNVDPFDLSIINQTGCPTHDEKGYNIHIDQDTFSAANIGGVVKKAGEKLGDGVEWTIDATKKLYKSIRGQSATDAPTDHENLRNFNGDPEAEWIRV